ncbi:MAG: dihydrodipicolinate synthase family protein [Bryobacteraceae bacterium]
MSVVFEGVVPAVVTPFTSDERFSASAMESLLERLYTAGCHGVYVCGQTGEGLLQPLEMRQQVAEVSLKNSPKGKSVIVHAGAARTEDAISLVRHASKIGVHAVSSLPPAGNYTFEEIRAYYEALSAASDVPVLVYFFPEMSPAIRSTEQILDLCSIPNVVGLKFTDFDLFKLSLIQRGGHVIYNGRDEIFAAGLLMGACGGIGSFYNLVPRLFVEVYEHSRSGRWNEARMVQDRINDLIAIGLEYPLFPAIKTILRWSGIDCGPCLAPRRSLTEAEEHDLRLALRRREFDESAFLSAAA